MTRYMTSTLFSVDLFYFQPTLGTNPLALAAPGTDGDSFVLDMATSSVALGKVSWIQAADECV